MAEIEYFISAPKNNKEDPFKIKLNSSGIFITSEEAGTLWVWAYPDLMKWHCDVAWLFPKVSSDGVGDLWGIDEYGDLLIVETKRSTKKKRLEDPFKDFVQFKYEQYDSHLLNQTWETLYEKELRWIRSGRKRPKGAAPGVVPYSYHRSSILRWIDFYDNSIVPILESSNYVNKVKNYLGRRDNNKDPKPHFIGLFTVVHSGNPGLSKKGVKHYKQLKEKVGMKRLHKCAVRGINVNKRQAKIQNVEVN